jgi:hypothetical protein
MLSVRGFACATIEGDSITVGDLARANPEFLALDSHIVIAPAPLAGALRTLRSGELLALARRSGITLAEPVDDICFERAWEPLTATLLARALSEQIPGGKIDIADFSRVRIPLNADRKFEITGTIANIVRGRVTYGSHSVAFWARVNGPVAIPQTNLIERGEPVSVEVRSGSARLAFDSTAESSGHPGESILVRNPQNGKLFQAKVQMKGKVLVQR